MGLNKKILFGHVKHKRTFPKENTFSYKIYYFLLPLLSMKSLPVAHNRRGLLSFYDRDHGLCDGSDLEAWARNILLEHSIDEADGEIQLVCMPRVLGYVFNPVSFWFCYDRSESLRALLCEVHNTFGEGHTYLCVKEDHQPITPEDRMHGEKLFHVSPFLECDGYYQFQFSINEKKLYVGINYSDQQKSKTLMTSLMGELHPMNLSTCRKAFWQYPLVTSHAVFLIHWQALKLIIKGIRYRSKPLQKEINVSTTNGK
jgi:hypothetical protein